MTPDNGIALKLPPRVRAFSLRGRIGRAHYIACSLGSIVVSFLFIYLISFLLVMMGELGRMLYIVTSVLLFYALLPIYFIVLTIRRSHDFNFGGWLALLLLVPIVNLMFWFVPGTKAENTYGAVPPSPSTSIKIVAFLFPALLIGGYLATMGGSTSQDTNASPISESNKLKEYTP
jgi:uncharacterized membrane protein YhaH (DUF805 family)